MEIQEKNRRDIPLWNIAALGKKELRRRCEPRRSSNNILIYFIIIFNKSYKIRDTLTLITPVRDQHGNLSGDRISVPVIGGDQLQLFFIDLPVISKHKADPKPILCHLNGNIKVWNLLLFVGAATKLAFPPLIDDHADHGIVEGLNKRHLFDRVQRSVFRGNDVELFLKQADLIAEIREIAADEPDVDGVVDQVL